MLFEKHGIADIIDVNSAVRFVDFHRLYSTIDLAAVAFGIWKMEDYRPFINDVES